MKFSAPPPITSVIDGETGRSGSSRRDGRDTEGQSDPATALHYPLLPVSLRGDSAVTVQPKGAACLGGEPVNLGP